MQTNGDVLTEMMDRMVKDGEVPWKANRDALKEFDVFHDDNEGRQDLLVMLEGLDILIADLERFADVAERVAQQSLAAIR